MKIKSTDLAWAAGIVDGEGCLYVSMQPTPGPARSKSPRFALHLKVTMGHRPSVVRLLEIFGCGTIQNHMPKSRKANASYSWLASARMAQFVLKKIRPFLITKAEEADAALEFLGLPLSPRGGRGGGRRMPASLREERERLYWKLRQLKSRWRFFNVRAPKRFRLPRRRS